MIIDDVNNEYFRWMVNLVCAKRFAESISYSKLLAYLHGVEFRYLVNMDGNRADDGIELRYRFARYHSKIKDADSYITGPCSVLEMLIALAIRCEETIMDDPGMGNRTGQWFWGMIVNLGLGAMTNERYNRKMVSYSIERFLDRKYHPDGKGGLFTVRNCEVDLRGVEIWNQLCYYLNTIT